MKDKLLTFSAIVLLGTAGLSVKAQSSWLTTGNANVTASNFLGTTNANPIAFRTNNIERMRLTKNGQLGIGTTAPSYPLQINNPNWGRGISVTNSYSAQQDRVGI